MIRLFEKSETHFNHNETILNPFKCHVKEDENGIFELEYESKLDKRLENGKIIKAPTPRGEQLFRIYNSHHDLRKTTAKGRHIFYDLLGNFIEDSRPTATNGAGALNSILGGTLYPHRFKSTSKVGTISTAYYVRKNPIQAMLGTDNCLIANWGGYIRRDNFLIEHIVEGRDNGYDIRYGKNLQGISESIDDSKVITKIMPTWVEDNIVHMIKEKYIESPLIKSYAYPRVAEIRIEVPEGIEDKEKYVREEAKKYFTEHNIDKPIVNYKVNFISLRNTSDYKKYVWLEELDLYDVVHVIVPKLDINLKSNVISYKYDCLKERFESIEIGNFTNSMAKNTGTLIKEIDSKIEVKASELEQKQKEATDKLSGVSGGNIITRTTADGKPFEILVMDTDDMSTAKEVVRINKNGIGFSHNGILGPYSVGITIDGHIVADFIDTGTLTADLLKAGVFSDKQGNFVLSMDKGSFNLANKIIYDPRTNNLKISLVDDLKKDTESKFEAQAKEIDLKVGKDGVITAINLSPEAARIQGRNIILDGKTQVKGDFSVSGSALFGDIYADVVNVKNLNADNLTRGTTRTPYDYGKMKNGYYDYELRGNAVSFNGNSGYITIKDTGGRGQVDINGTVAARGPGYVYELNSGGLHGGYGTSMIGQSGYATQLKGPGMDSPSITIDTSGIVRIGRLFVNGKEITG